MRRVRMDRGRVDLEGSVVTWRCRTKEGRRGCLELWSAWLQWPGTRQRGEERDQSKGGEAERELEQAQPASQEHTYGCNIRKKGKKTKRKQQEE